MKLFYSFLFAASFLFCDAQVVHDIETGGGGAGNPAPYYSPQFIAIEIGDTVRWTNVQGSHNVDGRLATFPSNPEGFFSGQPSSNWDTFDHVFTIEGVYDFECGQIGHADTQFGTITVVSGTTSIREVPSIEMYVFPNPVSNELNVLTKADLQDIQILDVSRNVSKLVEPVSADGVHIIDISDLTSGIYFVVVRTENAQATKRFIKR